MGSCLSVLLLVSHWEWGSARGGPCGDVPKVRPRCPPGSDSFPERPSPRKGNTLYVHGAELSPELLRSAFSPFGAIIDLSLDSPRKWAGPRAGGGAGWAGRRVGVVMEPMVGLWGYGVGCGRGRAQGWMESRVGLRSGGMS